MFNDVIWTRFQRPRLKNNLLANIVLCKIRLSFMFPLRGLLNPLSAWGLLIVNNYYSSLDLSRLHDNTNILCSLCFLILWRRCKGLVSFKLREWQLKFILWIIRLWSESSLAVGINIYLCVPRLDISRHRL